jgi:hypothetical protein
MNAYKKIKCKLFLIDLIFELCVNTVILFFAFISDKIIETLIFYIAWQIFRKSVPKVFHIKKKSALMSVIGCGLWSCIVFIVAMRFTFNIGVSLFSSIIIGIIINIILYKIQDYIDLQKELSHKTIDIYKMNEQQLRQYGALNGLSNITCDVLVLKVIENYRWCEIMQERNFSKDGLRYHKQRINKKLNIKL